MFIGRTEELKFLNDYYQREENNLIVLYGRRGIGKTELLRVFSKDKQCIYYNARECSIKEQYNTLTREWENYYNVKVEEGYCSVLEKAAEKYSVLIIDEFHYMMKNSEEWAMAMNSIINKENNKNLLVILSSSSIYWVENDMVNSIGELAESISAFLKIKEFTFADIMSRFPDFNIEKCMIVYSLLGGVPAYLNLWMEKRSLRENIEALFLHKDGRLYREVESYLKTELKELSLYNTILGSLAERTNKLSDIYDEIGCSNAKINVYVKNLIEFGIVERIASYERYNKDALKGLYQIRERMFAFWYRFVFPNLSLLERREIKTVYLEQIENELEAYLEPFFVEICKEYLELLSDYKRLPYKIEKIGSWYGKSGRVDIVGETNEKEVFLGKCKWNQEAMTEEDLMDVLNLTIQAGIEADYYFLFSKNGFTNGLEVKARGISNMILMSLEDM